MELIERVAAALWRAEAERAAPNVARNRTPEVYCEQSPETRDRWDGIAKAAIRAMLDGVEPVALLQTYKDDVELALYNHGAGYITDGDRNYGWTETPLYSLGALKEALGDE